MKGIRTILLVLSFCSAAHADPHAYSCLRNFFVSTSGIDAPNRGTSTQPWATIQYANDAGGLRAGDCVGVGPGVYLQPWQITLSQGGSANRADGFVTYIGHDSVLRMASGATDLFQLQIEGNYINVTGFEFDGHGINDFDIVSFGYHHLGFVGNYIHDSGGGGIYMQGGDYFQIIGNTVKDVCSISIYGESGIDVLHPSAIPNLGSNLVWDNESYHILISGNITQNCNPNPDVITTDSNGITLDDFFHTQTDQNAYPFSALVQGNLAILNGGAGIRVYASKNVAVDHNTVYGNSRKTYEAPAGKGDLNSIDATDIWWTNNIVRTFRGTDGNTPSNAGIVIVTAGMNFTPQTLPPSFNVYLRNNLVFDGIVGEKSYANFGPLAAMSNVSDIGSLYGVDPQFADPPDDFHLRPSSPGASLHLGAF